ncbi:hypothetical protein ABLE91_24720 [Aquabacter sp. CN5-332]|uniref:hypothetical protein n=1 Tax=Aquabacter sp. CN5-332 TaxID=3156608 RepID=UPI0032B48A83
MPLQSHVPQLIRAPAFRSRLTPAVYGGLRRWAREIDQWLRFQDHVRFENRSRGASVLVCMLAGYKADLWPYVMPRFRAALPDVDVCIVSPGLHNAHLAELCAHEGWSYLSTSTNDVCLAQNVSYAAHESAELIVKVDEDMFLLPDSLSSLIEQYRRIKSDGIVDPGFVAPVIPVNGFCYRYLLEQLDLLDAYEAKFGRARIAGFGVPIQLDPAAARWMWEHTAPLEETARLLAARPVRTLLCPVQFSIGLVAFERAFWEQIGHFPVFRRRLLAGMSTLGADEEYICAKAVSQSRPAVVTTAAFAGHFSFGPQYAAMKSLTLDHPEYFAAMPPTGPERKTA